MPRCGFICQSGGWLGLLLTYFGAWAPGLDVDLYVSLKDACCYSLQYVQKYVKRLLGLLWTRRLGAAGLDMDTPVNLKDGFDNS